LIQLSRRALAEAGSSPSDAYHQQERYLPHKCLKPAMENLLLFSQCSVERRGQLGLQELLDDIEKILFITKLH
jgi:hypothetical protein